MRTNKTDPDLKYFSLTLITHNTFRNRYTHWIRFCFWTPKRAIKQTRDHCVSAWFAVCVQSASAESLANARLSCARPASTQCSLIAGTACILCPLSVHAAFALIFRKWATLNAACSGIFTYLGFKRGGGGIFAGHTRGTIFSNVFLWWKKLFLPKGAWPDGLLNMPLAACT